MKKILLVLLLSIVAFAEGEPGIPALVELTSGTKQAAQFLGIENDTVSLGGTIQGKFTVIRIPRDRFKRIVDEKGNDLLTIANSTATTKGSLGKDSVSQVATGDSTAVLDSSVNDSNAFAVSEPTFLDSVSTHHIFVSFERRNSDSTLANQLENLIIRLLKESGNPITTISRTKFSSCSDAGCIRDSLTAHGAASAYIGRITAARTPDSVAIQMTHFVVEDSAQVRPYAAQMNLSAMRSMSDALAKNKLSRFVAQLQGDTLASIPAESSGKSFVRIETTPDGSNISIRGRDDICKSPCTFAITDTGKVEIFSYWGFDKQLWGAKASVAPIPGDTAKISLKLKRVRPELLVNTIPEGAEIFAGSTPLTKSTKPIGHSPAKFTVYEPGFSTVQVRKAGYRDTMLTVYAAPTEITDVSIELTPISNKQELVLQEEWRHERKKNTIGKTLMGTSIAPLLLGALFTYLAYTDYDDADRIKQELDRPSAGGENYKAKAKENKDLVHSGDRKMIIGGSLLGGGILLLGFGIVLTF
ncbi:PEGA domain-containing protein [Fibrobacter sp.]|uniref:PEGA domain-containing protein n=1 Tax=Fibrobacter sp. TaxID=35828 RepID=UPI0038908813